MRTRTLATLLLLAPAAPAAEIQKYQIDNEGKRIRGPYRRPADGKLVYDVTFRVKAGGREGDYGEARDAVVIAENGAQAVRLDLAQVRSGSLAIVLVLDVSLSMAQPPGRPRIDAMKEAASRFLARMPASARATVLPFNSRVGTPGPFSGDPDELRHRVEGLRPEGGTVLYDAALAGVETLAAGRPPGQRFVVVLTDGVDEDPGSRHGLDEVIERAQQERVALFPVGLGRKDEVDEAALGAMARRTGGRFIPVSDPDELAAIYEGLAAELDRTYTVTFPSLNQRSDGTVSAIDLYVVDRQGNVVSNTVQEDLARPGLLVPEVDYRIYLLILAALLVLLSLPAALKRRGRGSGAA